MVKMTKNRKFHIQIFHSRRSCEALIDVDPPECSKSLRKIADKPALHSSSMSSRNAYRC